VSAPAASTPRSFRARAARGTVWTGVRYAAEYSIRLGSNLILTRLLFPEAFGVMALVNSLMMGLAMFSDIGLTSSVVQSPLGDQPRFLHTAWTLQVLRGVLLFGVAVALAGPMATFYGHDELRRFIPVAGLTALISGFNSVSLIQMQRHLELGRLASIELITQALSVGVTIAWAFEMRSVWALVGGAVVGSLLKLGLSHALAGGRVSRFTWEPRAARHILEFGKWIFLSTMLAFLASQADRLLFGKVFSVAMLGVYGIGSMLASLPIQLLFSVGSFVIMPAFSRQAETPDALEKSYRTLQLPVLLAGGLPAAGLIACGPELIDLLYDPRYTDAGWMLQLLAVGVWFQVPQTLSANALLAVGKPGWMAIGNALKLLGMITLVPGGYALFGIPGAILGLTASETFRWSCFAFAAGRYRLFSWGADLSTSVLVLVAALSGWLATQWLQAHGVAVLPRLLAGTAVVLGVWIPASLLLLRDRLPGLWARARRLR
jgi:O-antigen/teichoic acid export membrane protein